MHYGVDSIFRQADYFFVVQPYVRMQANVVQPQLVAFLENQTLDYLPDWPPKVGELIEKPVQVEMNVAD